MSMSKGKDISKSSCASKRKLGLFVHFHKFCYNAFVGNKIILFNLYNSILYYWQNKEVHVHPIGDKVPVTLLSTHVASSMQTYVPHTTRFG